MEVGGVVEGLMGALRKLRHVRRLVQHVSLEHWKRTFAIGSILNMQGISGSHVVSFLEITTYLKDPVVLAGLKLPRRP